MNAEAKRARSNALEARVERLGVHLTRIGLVVVLAWIGAMKFTAYEAGGIEGLVANSPLMSWTYSLAGVRSVSGVIGGVEILLAAMIAVRPFSARISAAGSLLTCGMFLVTMSFLVTTPGVWEPQAGGFPALSVVPGQFLLKDIPLLGASLWTGAEAWKNRKATYESR